MPVVPTLIVMVSLLPVPQGQARQQAADSLVRARQAYNEQRFDEAVTLAGQAAGEPSLAQSAALVRGRALLERYRRAGDVADVAVARQSLIGIDPHLLRDSERAELRLAMAELLFVDEQFGAAAEVFARALEETSERQARTRVLDWWASSLDRHAQLASDAERQRRYAQLLSGLAAESVETGVVLYWRAAAYRGLEDFDRAWAVAIAAWIQAPLHATGSAVVTLRTDVDRLMREAIIPERARHAPPPADPAAVRVALSAEWDAIKARWSIMAK